jgi:UPF0755 protein
MSRGVRTLLILLVVAAAALFAADQWLQHELVKPGPALAKTRVEIAAGSTFRGVLAVLAQRGVLSDPRAVELALRVRGRRPQVKAGTYDIPRRASAAEVIRRLEKGDVVLEQLTVVEGSTFAALRRTLERHPGVRATLRGKSDAEVMIAIGSGGEQPEGRFFPDTYRFAARTTDVDILRMAHSSMQRALDEAWKDHAPDLPVRTPDEALILASIVEKETGMPAERPRIAGVFMQRLRLGMRLQSDPTVIYGMGVRYDGDIRTRDLTTDTPYNTYTRAGLPPTPIALPGRGSLQAVAHPEETGALYFVAIGDGSGAHYFSKTLEEHNEAVRRYLARLRNQAGAARSPHTSGEP